MGRVRAAVAAFLAIALATGLALYPLCALLHRCGCTAPWWGGAALCNVHHSTGPHCPWCEHPVLGLAATLAILALQGLAFHRLWKRRSSVAAGILGATLTLLPATVFSGGLLWLLTDYPHFLAKGARGSLGIPDGPLRCVAKPAGGASCCDGARRGLRESPPKP